MSIRMSLVAVLMIVGLLGVATPAQAITLDEAVAKIDAMMADLQALKTELRSLSVVSTPTPSVQGVQTSAILTMDLSYGATNDDIARIQRLLATDPAIYEYGVDSGFFGPKTQEAIRNFQARFGLDTVGVIGPSTKALLEVYLAAYPGEQYPADVLKKTAPSGSVLGASTSNTTNTDTSGGLFSQITIDEEDDEFIVRSRKSNGTRYRDLILYSESESELVEDIADELGITEAAVRALVSIDDDWFSSSSKSSRGADEDDAEEAIDDADDALDEVRDLIDEAEDDDVDTDDAQELYDEARGLLDEAEDALDDEDYDEAVDLAEEAEDLAGEAEDELDSAEDDAEEIDSIEVEIGEDESEVTVRYGNGDKDRFDVEETDQDDLIEEIADELDIDESDVEDLVEFDYGDIERVLVIIEDDGTRVRVYFASGFDLKYTTDEDDEDDILEEVADEYDLDEDEMDSVLDVDDRR